MRGWIPTGILAATLLFGSTVNAGVITGGLTDDPCKIETSEKADSGVITGGLTGVITGGFGVITGGFGVITGGLAGTGIIVTDLTKKDTEPVNCGIIVVD
jgi:hypothetical protein